VVCYEALAGLPRLQRVSGWKTKFEWLWRNLRSSCIDSESVIGGGLQFLHWYCMLHTNSYIDTYLHSFVSGHVGVSRALYVVSLVTHALQMWKWKLIAEV